jgi:hypothetical protein
LAVFAVKLGSDRPLAGLSRVCLGEGKSGMVRYIREEVIAYEESRRSTLRP